MIIFIEIKLRSKNYKKLINLKLLDAYINYKKKNIYEHNLIYLGTSLIFIIYLKIAFGIN